MAKTALQPGTPAFAHCSSSIVHRRHARPCSPMCKKDTARHQHVITAKMTCLGEGMPHCTTVASLDHRSLMCCAECTIVCMCCLSFVCHTPANTAPATSTSMPIRCVCTSPAASHVSPLGNNQGLTTVIPAAAVKQCSQCLAISVDVVAAYNCVAISTECCAISCPYSIRISLCNSGRPRPSEYSSNIACTLLGKQFVSHSSRLFLLVRQAYSQSEEHSPLLVCYSAGSIPHTGVAKRRTESWHELLSAPCLLCQLVLKQPGVVAAA